MRPLIALLLLSSRLFAQELEPLPNDPFFSAIKPLKAPRASGLLLQKGDRLAICGDSITEQKMYSRVIETYLTVAAPELEVTVRQYGWSGETAPGFLSRMTNDCLRFNPTIATTCYGMNDHGYRSYEPAIGDRYRAASLSIIKAFKSAGTRVIQGSPGCVGKVPPWAKDKGFSVQDMNVNLCELRNIDIQLAAAEQTAFADVFLPMLTAGFTARQRHGETYGIAGGDGVHPGWAGSFVMAYAYLKSMGLDGQIGTITLDWPGQMASSSAGHEVLSFQSGAVKLKSGKYPFCAPAADVSKDDNIRSAMALIPFNEELNRFLLIVKNPPAKGCRVNWGGHSKDYSAETLSKGVNLAADFPQNPFIEAFNRVDAAVTAKQNYETRQIKTLFHGEEGRTDMEATASLTEKVRAPLANAIKTAFVPVTHQLEVQPLP